MKKIVFILISLVLVGALVFLFCSCHKKNTDTVAVPSAEGEAAQTDVFTGNSVSGNPTMGGLSTVVEAESEPDVIRNLTSLRLTLPTESYGFRDQKTIWFVLNYNFDADGKTINILYVNGESVDTYSVEVTDIEEVSMCTDYTDAFKNRTIVIDGSTYNSVKSLELTNYQFNETQGKIICTYHLSYLTTNLELVELDIASTTAPDQILVS